jgi:hypothetical protein
VLSLKTVLLETLRAEVSSAQISSKAHETLVQTMQMKAKEYICSNFPENLDLFPSSGDGGDTYSTGCLRKSQPQSLDNPCQYNYSLDLSFRYVHALSQFLLHIYLLSPFKMLSLRYLYSCRYTDMCCPVNEAPSLVDRNKSSFRNVVFSSFQNNE